MATVEYYFRTHEPTALANVLSEKLGYEITLSDAELDREHNLPELASYQNWYVMDSFDDYDTPEHRNTCRLILQCSKYFCDSLESHSSILDSWWSIGQSFS